MAANLTNAYNKMAGLIAFKLMKNLPVLARTRQQASDRVFEGNAANGVTMNYVLPSYGTVGSGGTITEAQMSYSAGTIPLTLHQKNIPFTAGTTSDTDLSGTAREANKLLSAKDMVDIPLAAHLASSIQTDVINTGFLGAGGSVVVGASETPWDGFAAATAAIRENRAGDDLFGVVSPTLQAKSARGAANLFNPAPEISKLWKECTLGRYAQADWFSTADVSNLTTGTANLTATGITVSSYTASTNTIVIGATSLTGTVKAGQTFTVAGVNQADPFGRDTGLPFSFVVQQDATAASNSISLVVQPIYTSGGLVNVTAAPAANAAVKSELTASSKYARALVWAKPGIGTGYGRLAPLEGAKNFKFESEEKGIYFYGAHMGDVMHRRNIWRLDILTGSVVVVSNWVNTVFYKV